MLCWCCGRVLWFGLSWWFTLIVLLVWLCMVGWFVFYYLTLYLLWLRDCDWPVNSVDDYVFELVVFICI